MTKALNDNKKNEMKAKIGGLVAATLTPFDDRGMVDVPRLHTHVRTVLSEGCDRIVLFGSTGEGASISVGDKIAALGALIDWGISPDLIILGVMENDAKAAERSLKAAADLKLSAALLLPPYYYPTSDAGIINFIEQACGTKEPDLDIILYHIPQLARVGFSHSLLKRIVDRFGGRILGIKDSAGIYAHTLELVYAFPDLAVFTGTDTDLPPLLDAGGAGMIGGLPNINARGLRQIMETSGQERDAASIVASRLLRVVEDNGGISALKAITAARYQDEAWLTTLPPLRPLGPKERTELLAQVADLGYVVSMG